MVIDELKGLYQGEQLVEAIVEPVSDSGQWIVSFRDSQGHLLVVTEPEGNQSLYGDVNSASQCAMSVGFRQVKIVSSFS